MTRTLILMRHAKSSHDGPALSDHARPLAPRGQRAADALGHWLRSRGWLPDRVLCSTALRTRETLAGLALDAPAEFTEALYHAGAAQMRTLLSRAEGDTVLLVGHNPGIGELAQLLVTAPPDHERFHDYPTGATLVVRFDIDGWSQVTDAVGHVLDFVTPPDLPIR